MTYLHQWDKTKKVKNAFYDNANVTIFCPYVEPQMGLVLGILKDLRGRGFRKAKLVDRRKKYSKFDSNSKSIYWLENSDVCFFFFFNDGFSGGDHQEIQHLFYATSADRMEEVEKRVFIYLQSKRAISRLILEHQVFRKNLANENFKLSSNIGKIQFQNQKSLIDKMVGQIRYSVDEVGFIEKQNPQKFLEEFNSGFGMIKRG